VGTDAAIGINNKEYLDNLWHRFGLFAHLHILDAATCKPTCRTFFPGRTIDASFRSGAHLLSCSSCGTLKPHNTIAYCSLAELFEAQDLHFDKGHKILESFGKHAVDGLLFNPYLSSRKPALDVTVTCPACPSYVKAPATIRNTRKTAQAEAAKHHKYDDIARKLDLNFAVAVFTTYGGWGEE
jgi:hypothetical protein